MKMASPKTVPKDAQVNNALETFLSPRCCNVYSFKTIAIKAACLKSDYVFYSSYSSLVHTCVSTLTLTGPLQCILIRRDYNGMCFNLPCLY